MEENKLYAGFAEAKVTPPLGNGIPGYFRERISDGVITDLYIRAAAFACGEKKAILFSCDAIGIRAPAADIVRPMIAKRCGIPEEAITIACSHSHTAFRITVPTEENNKNDIFLKRLFQQFADTAQFAFEDLRPAALKTAAGEVKNIAFLRRYRMKDGTVQTNPPLGAPIDRPEGLSDESLRLVRVVREGAKELLLVNFGTHADVVSGNKFCADYPGFLAEDLKGALGGEAEVLFFNGCEGDSNHFDPALAPGTPRQAVHFALRMARKIAGETLKIYDDAKDVPCDGIDYKTAVAEVGKNPYDPADLPIARKIVEIYDRTHSNRSPELEPYKDKMKVPEAIRIVANLSRPDVMKLRVSLLRIGELAFVGIPGEPFQEIGLVIKEKSPYPLTVVTACTNGYEGYYPTRAAFEAEGYERSSSPFAWDVAERIEEAALEGLNELHQSGN